MFFEKKTMNTFIGKFSVKCDHRKYTNLVVNGNYLIDRLIVKINHVSFP